jgi:hypothetical protein
MRLLSAHFAQSESAHIHKVDATGQGLRCVPHQVRGRTSEYKKASANRTSVGEHTEVRQQIRKALDLINDHDPGQWFEGEPTITETRKVARVLKIKVCGPPVLCEDASQSGLPALARSKKSGYRTGAHPLSNALYQLWPLD